MFKSKDEACLKPSSFKSKSCILGIGNGFLLICLSSFSEIKGAHPFFLGLMDVGATQSELFLNF